MPSRWKKTDVHFDEALSYKAPLILAGVGLLLHVVHAFWTNEILNPAHVVLVKTLAATCLNVALGLVACLVATPLLPLKTGDVVSTVLKLSAVMLLPAGVALFLPDWMGTLALVVLYFALMYALFDLDGFQPLWFALLLLGVHLAVEWGFARLVG